MSDDADVERLLKNLQDAIEALNTIDDDEGLLSKLNSTSNRKLLKRVKNAVSDVHGKVNVIKDKVSKAYKRVKTRSTDDSIANESLDKEGSDKDEDSGGQTGDCNNEDVGRLSPVIASTRASRRLNKARVDKEVDNSDSLVCDGEVNGPIDQEEGVNNSTEEIIENVFPKTPKLKISLSGNKNKGSIDGDESVVEILDETVSSECNEEENNGNEKENDTVAKLDKNVAPSDGENEKRCSQDEEKSLSDADDAGNPVAAEDVDETENNDKAKEDDNDSDKSVEKNKEDEQTPVEAKELDSPKENDDTPNDDSQKSKVVVPKIKLVDINKLLAPVETTPSPTKGRKSVTFDNSVIVLTSSDEDTPKRDPKEKEPSSLKSALRKTSQKIIDLSDSDSKENNENLRNTKKTVVIKQRKRLCSDHSSDDSDDSDYKTTRGSRRVRKHITERGERFSRLVRERGERARKRQLSSENEPTRTRKNLKRNRKREDSSESEDNSKASTKKQRKDEAVKQISLSDVSESEEESYKQAKNASTRKRDSEPDLNDPKIKAPVIIRLPKVNIEELPDLYREKKELFEIKKSSVSNEPSKEDSSNGAGAPENRKIKLTLKLNRQKEDEKSDDVCETSENHDKDSASEDENAVLSSLKCLNDAGSESDAAVKEKVDDEPAKEADKEDAANKDKENATNKEEAAEKPQENKQKSPIEDDTNDSDVNKDTALKSSESEAETVKNSDEENTEKTTKKKSRNNRRAATIESSDSDDDFAHFSRKTDHPKKHLVREAKKRVKNKLISDSESDGDDVAAKSNDESDDADFKADDKPDTESSDSESEKKKLEEKKSARRRIKRVKDSSSDDEDKSTRKQIRKMIDRDSLSETTKKAEEKEKQRKARIAEKQKKYNQIFELKADATVDKVVLDFDEKTNKPLLSVHKKIVKQLKPHQVLGVKFMWDASFESLDRSQKAHKGSGCILAHCMGLGKTLQVIALAHTLLTHSEKTKVEKILVVCPVNTVLNWKNEFRKWMPDEDDFEVYELVSCKTSSVNQERNYIVKCWHEGGGVLIIGYSMFRTLSNPDNKTLSKKLRQSFQTGLVDPGPDLVVCDEGHLLKNEKTHLSIAMNRIKTARRIVLTGTPLQNNLREYWCMVQFIKPNLLGTYKEYLNRFVNPITNGQYTDSTQHDIMVMRRRSHVLHKLLDGVVQRQDYAVLEPYLPPKYEYVVFLKLTEVQVKLYRHYMDNFARKGDGSNRTSFLFTDFQQLQRICTHPRVLLEKSMEDKDKKEKDDESESEGSLKDFIDDGGDSTPSDSDDDDDASGSDGSNASVRSNDDKKKKKKKKSIVKRKRVTRAQAAQKRLDGNASESEEEPQKGSHEHEWFDDYINRSEMDNINHSAKIFLLFQILKECEEIGDKILVFSQSLYSLNCIEYFLARIDEATQKGDTEKVGGHAGSWSLGLDYFRLDGSSSCDNRASWCDHFNDPENTRARLFLISTKAGGLGINLVAANRVIIFDVSWNPSHDIQSIYRVYRFGQNKPSYIYRFVTYGAMEMKIYERQVTKQAISKRVIDEQQIDRHYSQNDIMELYKTDLEPADRPIPMVPKDVLLGELLQTYDKTIFKYHEHQSLLENKQDEELNEEERKAAWEEFENEKVIRKTNVTNFGGVNLGAMYNNSLNFSPQLIQLALGNIVRKDNPTWSDVQIKGILPALVAQLQMQMSENDFSMYHRVQEEIRRMQVMHAQRMQENFIKQYQMQQMQQMLQKQHMANQMLDNMNITPEELRRLQMAQASQNFVQPPQAAAAPGRSSDVIELND